MKAKRHIETSFETHETTIIRFAQSQSMIYCESCQTNRPHFTAAEAFSILLLSELEISRLAGDKQIHAKENAGGLRLLCGSSLAAFKQNKSLKI